jgi:sulfoxide reductase heme-binding subunit YedZ
MIHKVSPRLISAVTHVLSLLPLAILIFYYFSGRLAPNPAQALEQLTGRIAISLLMVTLLVNPLSRLFKLPVIMKVRRPLGLYTFIYVILHILILVGFDYQFDLKLLLDGYLNKPFIWFGILTGLILAVLALTSIDRWKHKLGDRWGRLHSLVYLAAILDLAHYFLVVKGNVFSLSGNFTRPLIFSGLFILIMSLKILQRKHPPAQDVRTQE